MKSRIAVIAAGIREPWGGSEELWSRGAIRLVEQGVTVAASIQARLPIHERVHDLMRGGVKVWLRPERYPLWKRMQAKILTGGRSAELLEVVSLLNTIKPELVVLSTGVALPSIELVELCRDRGLPFVTIGQANSEILWFEDEIAARYRQAIPAALRCYFVSWANLRLAERQIGCDLLNGEVVRNPFNVDVNSSPPWPSLTDEGELRLACVGRLDPRSKGQDIVLEALATPVWMDRWWRLTFYGTGPMKDGIERLVHRLGLAGRVTFAGYVSPVEDIWSENHALLMPSRGEGLPLAMVEAMLCGRAVIATDIGGHSEIVEEGITGFLADAATVASVTRALERMWECRFELRRMGEAASRSIRKKIPADPAKVFSENIRALLDNDQAKFGSVCQTRPVD